MHSLNARLFTPNFISTFGPPVPIVNGGFNTGNVGRRGILAEGHVCEPKDTQGNTLDESTNDRHGSFDCLYADPGSMCYYSTADGFLTDGFGPACPPTLAGVVVSSPSSDSVSAPTAGASSTFRTGSSTMLTSQTPSSTSGGSGGLGQSTSQPTQPSTGGFASTTSSTSQETSPLQTAGASSMRTTISRGAAAGISVAVTTLLLGFIVAFVLCRRRRQPRGRDSERDTTIITPRVGAISPFPVIVGLRGNTVLNKDPNGRLDPKSEEKHTTSETSQFLRNVPSLEDPGLIQPAAPANVGEVAAPQSITYTAPEMPETNARPPGDDSSIQPMLPRDIGASTVEAELQASRDQIKMLLTRVNALEANTDLVWGPHGPPPEYT